MCLWPLKLPPDLTHEELIQVADSLVRHHIDGVIATNTTLDKSLVSGLDHCNEAGGLSGRPVQSKSTQIIRQLNEELKALYLLLG